jgi:hypothetical protein
VGWAVAAAAPICFVLLLPAIWSVFDESAPPARVTRVQVVQLEDDADALREPLTATRSLGGTLGILDLRGDHAASAVLAELGGTIDIRQHEMVHRL